MNKILRRPMTLHGKVIEQYSLDNGVSWQTLKGVNIPTATQWVDSPPIPRRRDKKCKCMGRCTHEYAYIRRGPVNRRVRRKIEGVHTRDVVADHDMRHTVHSIHYGESYGLTYLPQEDTIQDSLEDCAVDALNKLRKRSLWE